MISLVCCNKKFQIPNDWIVKDCNQEILKIDGCPTEYVEVSYDDIVVWVDPLDGTSEYTQVKSNFIYAHCFSMFLMVEANMYLP